MKLTIYNDRSILEQNGREEIFVEGVQNHEAKARSKLVRDTLAEGFLVQLIEEQKANPQTVEALASEHAEAIKILVDAVTSEVGRALIGITLMQLTIKTICPTQNIRLHKGGQQSVGFSWVEGISMRTLDKAYITPSLRKYGLLSLNADGIMMTRSLAENYPYTKLYKAAMRGARDSWLEIVDLLENGSLDPGAGLRYLISLLINRTNEFEILASQCIASVERFIAHASPQKIANLLTSYVYTADYSARLFEIAVHAAFQVLDEQGALLGSLKPLSQMRSANKKHGNIGDVEVLLRLDSPVILESWDTKFGKQDLREELEEISEKLADHPDCRMAGFVTNQPPLISERMQERIDDLELLHDIEIKILSFADFVQTVILPRAKNGNGFFGEWLRAFTEVLCQKRRHIAPVDEPSQEWVRELRNTLDAAIKT